MNVVQALRGRGPRVVVLVKQVPKVDDLVLGPDGRLVRQGTELELNPYCRRAVTKGVELARVLGGRCVVITLGPPAAEDVLREALACGADYGVLVSGDAFRGSDSYATARALAAAIRAVGGSELVLTGRNSVDADTGQVGPAVAESLGHGFLGSVRSLEMQDGTFIAGCQQDDRWVELKAALPLVISCAERLCEPAKAPPAARAAVSGDRIIRLGVGDLGRGPWGQAGSLTSVGQARPVPHRRLGRRLSGDVGHQVADALGHLVSQGVLRAVLPEGAAPDLPLQPGGASRRVILAILDPEREQLQREILGTAAGLAGTAGATVTAAVYGDVDPKRLTSWGADQILLVSEPRPISCDQVAGVLGEWSEQHRPWAVLASGTVSGREVCSRMAMRLAAGMTGDAVEVEVSPAGQLAAWKPAFGGRMLAAITASSTIQVVTMRPGAGQLHTPRPVLRPAPVTQLPAEGKGQVQVLATSAVDQVDRLLAARVVVGVGQGVDPAGYELVRMLCGTLGAEMAVTRKVTDKGWAPHSRQVGITGLALAPDLYVAIGLAGKPNHMLGVRNARQVLAINQDPAAPVFDEADVGVVAPWRAVVPLLVEQLVAQGLGVGAVEQTGVSRAAIQH